MLKNLLNNGTVFDLSADDNSDLLNADVGMNPTEISSDEDFEDEP